MGAELFDRFADWTRDADAILGYSIRELCVDDPRGELGQTQFTQPALFVVNAMTYRARVEGRRGGRRRSSPATASANTTRSWPRASSTSRPACTLVQRRGAMMGEVSGGGMAAVIGLEPARIEAVLAASDAGRRLDVANFNSFDQTVIAGPEGRSGGRQSRLRGRGRARVHPAQRQRALPLALHARAAAEFASVLDGVDVPRARDSRHRQRHRASRTTRAPCASTLGSQIGHSVRWLDSMLYLLDQGVTEFEEVGPGSVLTKLVAQIRKKRPA